MGFVIAVPSYQRVEVFEKRAYVALSPELRRKTYVFVQTPEDQEIYSRRFPDVHVIPVKKGHRWKAGFAFACFFIRRYFPLGKRICFLHDDVAGVRKVVRSGDGCRNMTVELSVFIPYAFQKMKEFGVKLAGVYPTSAGDRCLRCPEFNKGLKFIYDPLHFEINVQLPMCTFLSKCDYEMTAEYFLQHGDILRFDLYHALTKHDSSHRDTKKLKSDTEAFVKRYKPLISHVKFYPGSNDFSPQFVKTPRRIVG